MLDGALVRDIDTSASRAAEVAAMVASATNAGAITIATQVEAPGQLRRLAELGCTLGIGHLFGLLEPAPTPIWFQGRPTRRRRHPPADWRQIHRSR